jgi:CheY-like chemotaxis protein
MLRVLVVDDEPMVRQLVTEYLTGDGHTVETASDGNQGLDKFRKGAFDLLLTDRAMPEMSGDHLADAVKAASPGTPVILLTGFGDIMMARDEKPPSVDLIVAKPVTVEGLREAIAQVTAPHDQYWKDDRPAEERKV